MPDSRTEIEANKAIYQRQKNFDALKNGLIKKYVEDGLDLKDRQQESIFKLTDTHADDYTLSSGYFHACTAFGKTYLMMAMAEGYRATKSDKKIIIFEENTNVLEQVREDFIEKTSFSEHDVGTYYCNGKMPQAPIIVCTYASMQNMVNEAGKENIGMVLCDEAHHGLSDKRKEFIKTTFNGACLYGFTGTPEYNANKTCRDLFDVEIDKVDIKEGVRKHLLCGVKSGLLVSRVPVDLSKIHRSGSHGDFDEQELMETLAKITNKQGIKEALADFYLNAYDDNIGYIKGKPTIINTPSKKEADDLATVINQKAGAIIAKAYHSDTTKAPLKEFDRGDFPILIQVNRISEGYNNPKVEVCINYPTASLVRETQCCGRTLRYDDTNRLKLALVLDVAFMQDPDGNVLDEVAKNGQVLFQNIAGGYYITSKEYEEHQKTQEKQEKNTTEKKDKPTIDEEIIIKENSLFNVKLDVMDLDFLNWEYEELKENRFILDKKDNDIGNADFINNYQVRDKDGNELTIKQKQQLYNKLIQDEVLIAAGIVAKRKTKNGLVLPFIIGDKIAEFNQISGYVIAGKDDTIPFKQDNDIGNADFINNYQVRDKDGNELTIKQKQQLYNKLIQDEVLITAGIIAKRKISTGVVFPFIIGDKLDEFNRISGYLITNKDDTIPFKQDNDIGNADFTNNYQVCDKDDNKLTNKQKQQLYNKFIQDEVLIAAGIVAKRKTGSGQVLPFIIGDKITELNRISGYVIVGKDDTIPIKQDNDIGYTDFTNNYQICNKDGIQVTHDQKRKLFNQLIQNEALIAAGIVAKRKVNNGLIFPFIIGDKIAEFNQISGYVIANKDDNIPLKQDNDIGSENFMHNYQVYDKDGNQIAIEQKRKLFNQLIQDEVLIAAGIVTKRKIGNGQVFPFIIGDKIAEFNQISGYLITNKDDTIPFKQENDIRCHDFMNNYQVCDKNGNPVKYEQRQKLFNQLIQDEALITTGIVAKRKINNGHIYHFIIGDKLDEFNRISGYTIITPLEQLHELQEKASTAQTPAEKNKYFTQAKKLFEKLNPKLKEQNLCAACLEKILGKHK